MRRARFSPRARVFPTPFSLWTVVPLRSGTSIPSRLPDAGEVDRAGDAGVVGARDHLQAQSQLRVGQLAVFLASDASQFITGQVIVIDGGLGQLHAAQQAFEQLDVKPPMVISLAKKEELIYVQAKAEPIRLSRNNLGLKLVQAARDEAHRFAQHYHHILRRKKVIGE